MMCVAVIVMPILGQKQEKVVEYNIGDIIYPNYWTEDTLIVTCPFSFPDSAAEDKQLSDYALPRTVLYNGSNNH